MALKKSDRIANLLAAVPLEKECPDALEGRSLLEHAVYVVMLPHLAPTKAQAALSKLSNAFPDWNELRVSQAQEIADAMAPKGRGDARVAKHLPAAREVKELLAQVFQETHGLDLEFLRTDPTGGVRQLTAVPMLGNERTAYLDWVAEEGALPISSGIVRVLDRFGAMTRTSSMKKAREALVPHVPKDQVLRFAMAAGRVADRWCDSRKPICWECPLNVDCPMGKKVVKEWETQQKRLAAQRAKEEARAEAARQREEARLAREAERERKRAEREAEKERKRVEREAARKKAEVAKKKAAQKKKAAAKKKKKSAAKKTVAAKTKKKAAKKATKKATKKTVERKTKVKKSAKKTAKKKAAKRSARKTATRKRATTRRR